MFTAALSQSLSSQKHCWRCSRPPATTGYCPFCGSSLSQNPAQLSELLAPGTVIDNRYEIQEFAGRSFLADSYRAVDGQCNRVPVLVKVARGGQSEKETSPTLELFLNRRNLTAKVRHPNVIEILHAGTASYGPYYVTPRFDDFSLEQFFTRGECFGFRESIELSRQLAAAVAAVNAMGHAIAYLHPRNIFVLRGDFFSRLVLSEPPSLKIEQVQARHFSSCLNDMRKNAGALYSESFEQDWITGRIETSQVRMVALITLEIFSQPIRHERDLEQRLRRPSNLPKWLSWLRPPSMSSCLDEVWREQLFNNNKDRHQSIASFVNSLESVTAGRSHLN